MTRTSSITALLFGVAIGLAVVLVAVPMGVNADADESASTTPDVFNCSCNALAAHEAEEAAAAALAATCAAELSDWQTANSERHKTSAGEWVSGIAASIVISLISLIGVGTFSFVPAAHRDHALQALLGLAFGTLIGGTFLDLLPECAEALGKFDVSVSAVCMCGIIFGYLTERVTHWVSGGTHSHSHGGDGGSAGHGHGHPHGGAAAHDDDAPGGHGNEHDHEHAHHPHKPMDHDGMGTAQHANGNGHAHSHGPDGHGHSHGPSADAKTNGSGDDIELRTVKVLNTPNIAAAPADDPLAFRRESDPNLSAASPALHKTGGGAGASGDKKDDPLAAVATSAAEYKPNHLGARGGALFGLTPLAILSLSGDAIHNFIDGLVVGAAFVSSINTGVITAVAVAVHEIPQEIGDFGILLQSGLTVKQALIANFAVACTCIAGTVITLALGEELGSNANYALPFAGGVFLYLALSGVVPEMQRYIAAEDRDEVERRRAGRQAGRLSCCGGSLVLSMTWLAAWGIVIGIGLMGVLTLLPHEHGSGAYEPSDQCAEINASAAGGHAH